MTSKEKPLAKGLANATASADDICRLLKACSRSGVQSIRWSHGTEVQVTFFEQGKPALPDAAESFLGSTVPADEAQTAEITRQSLEEDAETTREAILSELMIQDPAEYERRVVDGSLIDEPEGREETAQD